ncbi:hypothetical protein BDV95DRAFT_54180 [Massariosphaeria phaeospora]|uniref:Rhodopsin domain-containing protein n=1 Tax=Massariosphaeria phaeospora TaxID=100035 RepID=A0A7C8MND2_9PLEO|nr:hypothetical protein BDV95DRAFT_54180 [Massariosphaeria phaeospora]
MVELDGNSNQVIALHIACIIITSVAIALRFAARYRKRQSFAWDDGFMIVAWVTLMVYLGLVIKLTYMGSTMLTTAAIPPHDMINIFKLSYICGIIFETVNITVKVSILCFYTRIFTLEVIRREAYTVGAICAAWYTASVLVTAFQCVPVHKVWRRNAPGTCINLDGFILGYEVTNALLDIVLIVLPLRLIHSLNLDKRQKLLLSSIFLLGGL